VLSKQDLLAVTRLKDWIYTGILSMASKLSFSLGELVIGQAVVLFPFFRILG